jgi:hypothetical protein
MSALLVVLIVLRCVSEADGLVTHIRRLVADTRAVRLALARPDPIAVDCGCNGRGAPSEGVSWDRETRRAKGLGRAYARSRGGTGD